ncbi:MAG: hypothetical protein ACOYMA_04220 [Bacteroidia bacterium]
MNKTEDKPIILTKRKNIQTVLDYCLEQKISFSANPRAISIDEWELELDITTIKGAIALGIFVKENKLELYGMGTSNTEVIKPKPAAPAVTNKKAEPKEPIAAPSLIDELVLAPVEEENIASSNTLSFDLNNSNN